MKKVAIGGIFGLITAVLMLIFVFTIIKIVKTKNSTAVVGIANDITPKRIERASPNETPWYVSLANQRTLGFMPMSNELYIHFELASAGHSSKKKFFKLSIDKEDKYSLFCVKQTIAKLDLKYFFVNTKKDAKIIVDTTDVSMLHHLVDTLKGYRIGSSFEEIWI